MSELIQINALAPVQGTRKTSKVMLLFPPEWVPTAPYLALPSLTAVLRGAGHTVIQRDINIGMWDHFFSMEFLIWVKARLGMQLKPLQDKEKAGTLTDQEADQKAAVEQAYTVDVFDLDDRAEDAALQVIHFGKTTRQQVAAGLLASNSAGAEHRHFRVLRWIEMTRGKILELSKAFDPGIDGAGECTHRDLECISGVDQ